MQRTLELEAELADSFGYYIFSDGRRFGQSLGTKIPMSTDNKGNFNLPDGQKGIVNSVTYRVSNTSCDFYDREHNLSFEEYVKLGKPIKLFIRKTFEYVKI